MVGEVDEQNRHIVVVLFTFSLIHLSKLDSSIDRSSLSSHKEMSYS